MTSSRRIPAWLFVTAVLLLGARLAGGEWMKRPRRAAEELIAWRTDVTAAREEATRDGRPVLLQFSATWCMPCRQFDAEVLQHDATAEFINEHFVPVRIMDSPDEALATPGRRELYVEYDISSFPTMLVVSPSLPKARRMLGGPGPRTTRSFLDEALLLHLRAQKRAGQPVSPQPVPATPRSSP